MSRSEPKGAAPIELRLRMADRRRWHDHVNRLVWPPRRPDPAIVAEGVAKGSYILGRRLDVDVAAITPPAGGGVA